MKLPKPLMDTWTIARKELLVHMKTKRLLVIGAIFFAVVVVISIYGGYLTGQSQDEPTYEKGAAQVVIIVLSFASFFPAVMAITLTYDAIVGERVNNSMYLLVSKPVAKESIFIGKFLGAWGAIAGVYVVVMSLGLLLIVGLSGQWPSAADVGNVYLAIALILFGVAAWVVFTMLLSTTFKTTTTTLITAVLMWLFVFSLVSQAGLIYYAVTLPEPDYPVNVSISYTPFAQNMSLVTFAGSKLGQDINGFDVALTDSGGALVADKLIGDGAQVSFLVPSGQYTWSANGGENNSATVHANGSVTVFPDARLSLMVRAMESDYYSNDLSFSLTNLYGQPLPGGEYSLSKDGAVEYSETLVQSSVTVLNLTEGKHDFSYSQMGTVIVSSGVQSYGEELPGIRLINALTGGSDVPGYVKATYAISPSNCVGAYQYFLDPEYKGTLTMNESLASLSVFFVVCGAAGLLLFKKRDLV